nr:hypothetical protein [Mycobacterium montefiorense]
MPSESAWSVFTSARWHVSTWPGVPILLVCGNHRSQRALTANGVSRYVPVHGDRRSALGDALVRSVDGHRREPTRLPARAVSTVLARALIAESLHAWAQNRLIVNEGTVASVFVQNVLDHTDSALA